MAKKKRPTTSRIVYTLGGEKADILRKLLNRGKSDIKHGLTVTIRKNGVVEFRGVKGAKPKGVKGVKGTRGYWTKAYYLVTKPARPPKEPKK